jgi:2-methylcitrate dehydratase PrpD
MSDYLDRLVTYICDRTYDDLPDEVVQRCKQVLADTFAVIGSGAQEEEVKALVRQVVEPEGPRLASVIGTGKKTEPTKAGLINGTAGTFLELDEGNQFARGHPGIHVVPAALAIAEAHRLGGKDLICAVVLGYEIASRIGIACRIRMSMHPHGSWGTVGAAVAVGKLLAYEPGRMRELINVCSSLTLATSRPTMLEGGLVRNAYAGVSAYMGIFAHQLVTAGFTGEKDGLASVFGRVVSETFDKNEMTADLGERFEILRNYFKRHACCRYNHATLDALQEIMEKAPAGVVAPENIQRVDVNTYSLAAQLCDPSPTNTLAAKFSIPFAVATTIVNGHSGVDCFRPKAIADGKIRRLAKRVNVFEDPELTAMMPDRRPSKVSVTLKDGAAFGAEAFVNKGDFEDPYAETELEDKFHELADPVWGRQTADALFLAFGSLENLPDIHHLTRLAEK